MKVKRTSIADLIRPLREGKERERERDKEKEKGKGARSVEDANVCNDATTEGTVSSSHCLADDARATMASAKTVTTMKPPSETTSSYPVITTNPDFTNTMLSNLEEVAVPFLPVRTPSPVATSHFLTDQERSGVLVKDINLGGTPFGERRLKVTKRSLREGKSQSLILLTGLEPEEKDETHSKVSLTRH